MNKHTHTPTDEQVIAARVRAEIESITSSRLKLQHLQDALKDREKIVAASDGRMLQAEAFLLSIASQKQILVDGFARRLIEKGDIDINRFFSEFTRVDVAETFSDDLLAACKKAVTDAITACRDLRAEIVAITNPNSH